MQFFKKQPTLILLLFFSLNSIGQKQYLLQTVGFYNLENLFDTIDQAETLDERSPILEIKSGRSAIYKDKLSKLAYVLSKIGTSKNQFPPAIIGVVEVENKAVLQDLISTTPLVQFDYGIVHHDSPDIRGIDTALLYHKKLFKPINSKVIPIILQQNNQTLMTRDILWVSGYLMEEYTHILVNHWPSRRGGTQKSQVLREQVAQKCLATIQQIREEEPDAKIIAMGDFNDNPTNTSFKKILQTQTDKKALQPNDLFNPFEQLFTQGHHSLVFRGALFLFDQIFLSANYLNTDTQPKGFRFYKAGIYNPYFMTVQKGKYKGSPKRSFGGGHYLGGYSDHYPVFCYLVKEVKDCK